MPVLDSSGVLTAFIRGKEAHTKSERVPCQYRLHSSGSDLKSYCTVVAKHTEGGIAVTGRRYSVTTSKMVNQLRRQLHDHGFSATEETVAVAAAVPGRWGGFGPAWHPTGTEHLPFVVWKPRPGESFDWKQEKLVGEQPRYPTESYESGKEPDYPAGDSPTAHPLFKKVTK